MRYIWLIVLLLITSFAFSTEDVDTATQDFINEFIGGKQISKTEQERIRNLFWEEIDNEKIPLSVVQFVAKIMNRKMNFDSPDIAADYLLEVMVETDKMVRKGNDPLKIKAIIRQQTNNQKISAEQIQMRIRNRYQTCEENLQRQLRKGLNDRGENEKPSKPGKISQGRDIASPPRGPHGP